jgi:hypothetical protein
MLKKVLLSVLVISLICALILGSFRLYKIRKNVNLRSKEVPSFEIISLKGMKVSSDLIFENSADSVILAYIDTKPPAARRKWL